MKEPVMSLELYPCRRQQIQGRGWDEGFPSHEALTQHPWIRSPQLLFGWLRCQDSGEITPESHAGGSHQRHFGRIEFTI